VSVGKQMRSTQCSRTFWSDANQIRKQRTMIPVSNNTQWSRSFVSVGNQDTWWSLSFGNAANQIQDDPGFSWRHRNNDTKLPVFRECRETTTWSLVFNRDMLVDIPLTADLLSLQQVRQQGINKNLLQFNKNRIEHVFRTEDQVWIQEPDPD